MSTLDWTVLFGTVFAIVVYGVWKERGAQSAENYLRGGHDLRWWTIGLSIMATQASAITFLSLPGQAFEDGMGFVQFYLGLPVAMVILSWVIVPIYYRLKLYTAYEYLEKRFDRKTRLLTALLFLISRGLAAGISIYAPAIVLSTVMGWPLQLTNLAIGGVVIFYTVSGGTRAVSRTQTYQMIVMLGGMVAAFIYIWSQLPSGLSLGAAAHIAGALGRMKMVDYSLRLDTRYTFWSGMTGGLFLALAYFGTDQTQVQRYLSGASLSESRLGLLMNGIVKIPMQLLILFVGVLLFVFYQFFPSPIFFNTAEWRTTLASSRGPEAHELETKWRVASSAKRERALELASALSTSDPLKVEQSRVALRSAQSSTDDLRRQAKTLVGQARPTADVKDADYVFIGFVLAHFPPGLVGLLLAVILCAAMSATASALNSLGSTTVVDFYRLYRPIDENKTPEENDRHSLRAAKLFTIFWGVLAVLFATFASLVDNLIQAVNILGSIFYGPMLGIFLLGFFFPRVRATPAFIATLLAQLLVAALFLFTKVEFLWFNVIGSVCLIMFALVINRSIAGRSPKNRSRQT